MNLGGIQNRNFVLVVLLALLMVIQLPLAPALSNQPELQNQDVVHIVLNADVYKPLEEVTIFFPTLKYHTTFEHAIDGNSLELVISSEVNEYRFLGLVDDTLSFVPPDTGRYTVSLRNPLTHEEIAFESFVVSESDVRFFSDKPQYEVGEKVTLATDSPKSYTISVRHQSEEEGLSFLNSQSVVLRPKQSGKYFATLFLDNQPVASTTFRVIGETTSGLDSTHSEGSVQDKQPTQVEPQPTNPQQSLLQTNVAKTTQFPAHLNQRVRWCSDIVVTCENGPCEDAQISTHIPSASANIDITSHNAPQKSFDLYIDGLTFREFQQQSQISGSLNLPTKVQSVISFSDTVDEESIYSLCYDTPSPKSEIIENEDSVTVQIQSTIPYFNIHATVDIEPVLKSQIILSQVVNGLKYDVTLDEDHSLKFMLNEEGRVHQLSWVIPYTHITTYEITVNPPLPLSSQGDLWDALPHATEGESLAIEVPYAVVGQPIEVVVRHVDPLVSTENAHVEVSDPQGFFYLLPVEFVDGTMKALFYASQSGAHTISAQYNNGVIRESTSLQIEVLPSQQGIDTGIVKSDTELQETKKPQRRKATKMPRPPKLQNKVVALVKSNGESHNYEETTLERRNGKRKVRMKLNDLPITEIELNDVDENNSGGIYVEELNLSDEGFSQAYAIDPTQSNFTNGTVTATATGSTLFKCKEWDFPTQTCLGEWVYLKDIVPGEQYTFTLTPDDPGFGEGGGVVQRGRATGTTTQLTDTIQFVNMSQAFVRFRTNINDPTPDDWQFTPNITSATTITFDRYGTGTTNIDWEVVQSRDFHVQRGTRSLTTSEDVVTVTIDAVNLSQTFPIVYGRCADEAQNDNVAGLFAANFTSSTTLELRRGNEGLCAATVSYQVVSWKGATVQSNETIIPDGTPTVTAPISSIDTSETFLVVTSASIGTDPGMDTNLIQGSFTSPTQVQLTKETGQTQGNSERIVNWYAVSVPNAVVRTGSVAVSGDSNQAITAVDENRSFVISSGWNTGGGQTFSNSLYTLNLSTATNLAIDKQTGSQTQNIVYYVVQVPPNETDIPVVEDPYPQNDSNISVGTTISVFANMTDNALLDATRVNITDPTGTYTELDLILETGDLFNITYAVPNILGIYNFTFFANDTNDNRNDSVFVQAHGIDTTLPAVFDSAPTEATTVEVLSAFEIRANVTDNIGVLGGYANISYPNGSFNTSTLLNAVDNLFNTSFEVPDLFGQFQIQYVFNDTSDNVNHSITTYVDVVDSQFPAVFDARPFDSSSTSVGAALEIGINATDNLAINSTRANITFPNGSHETIILEPTATSRFNTSYVLPYLNGVFTITFLVNDTYGNLNDTTSVSFTAAFTEGLSGTYYVNETTSLQESFLDGNLSQLLFNDTLDTIEPASGLSGQFTSPVFFGGGVRSWNRITWLTNAWGPLPNNGLVETQFALGNIDMSANQLLYHMDEGSGNLIDSSGNSNDASPVGGATYGVTGQVGTAIELDGTTDYFTMSDPGLGTGSYAISMWINASSLAGKQATWGAGIVRSTTGENIGDFFVSVDDGGSLHFANWRSAGNDADGITYTADNTIVVDQLHHVVVSWDGASNYIYVDNQLQTGLATEATATGWLTEHSIGRQYTSATYYFSGTIDELAIWSRNVTEEDVNSLYERTYLTMNMSVRGCDDANCVGESFVNIPDNGSVQNPDPNNQYFQYKIDLNTSNVSFKPALYNVTLNYSLPDPTPPTSITNLQGPLIGSHWVYWNWSNPGDPDFDFAIVYVDGVNVVNTTNNYYNATGFYPNSNHSILVHTYDTDENINDTNVTIANVTLSVTEGYAMTYINNNMSSMNYTLQNGTFTDSFFDDNIDAIVMDGTVSASYVSEILDTGTNAIWTNITWISSPMGILSEDKVDEQFFTNNLDMTDNILLLHMNESSGSLIDKSGDGNDASPQGAPSYSQTGVFDTAVYLDGSSDYFTFSSFSVGAGSFGVSAWINANSLSSNNPTWGAGVLRSTTGENIGDFYVSVDDGGAVHFSNWRSAGDDADGVAYTSDGLISEGGWHHIVATWDGSTNRIYVDGNEQTSLATETTATGWGTERSIGRIFTSAGYAFDGTIDEVAVWTRNLTEEDVENLYKRSFGEYDVSIRSCDDTLCAGDSFEDIGDLAPQALMIPVNQYIQYRFDMTANSPPLSPELYNVTINYDSADSGVPNTIENLTNLTRTHDSIYWQWDNPGDPDFQAAIIYLDGVNVENTSNNYYNATELVPGTEHTILINVVDLSENVNTTQNTNVTNTSSITEGSSGTFTNSSIYGPENFSFYTGSFNQTYFNDVLDAISIAHNTWSVYTSRVFNISDNASWVNINWRASAYGPLPDNAIDETASQEFESRTIDMSSNELLYHMDESSGNLIDGSGNTNDGTPSGSPTYSADGVHATAVQFDGADDFFTYSDPGFGTGSYAISAWLYPTGMASFQATYGAGFIRHATGDNTGDFFVGVDDGGSVHFANWRNAGADADGLTYTADGAITSSVWNHVIVTWDGATNRIFVNGEEQTGLSTETTASGWGTETSVGRSFTGGDYHWEGRIDELALWSRNLSEQEVYNVYARGATNLTLEVRVCDDDQCNGESYVNLGNGPAVVPGLADSQYIQYRALFDSLQAGATVDLYNVTLSYDNEVPHIDLSSPLNDVGDNDGDMSFQYMVNDSAHIASCSVYLNGTIAATDTTITKDTLQNIAVNNLGSKEYNWSIECVDSHGATNISEERVVTVIEATGYVGNTTDLSTVNIEAIPNLIIDRPGIGMINYTETMNLSGGVNIDDSVVIGPGAAFVNLGLGLQLNGTAQITLRDITFQFTPTILRNGVFCNATDCPDFIYQNDEVRFNVTRFSNYSTAENSLLATYDETDPEGGGFNRYVDDMVMFFANYTNRTDGTPINNSGTFCNISFAPTETFNMTYNNESGVYEYNRSFSTEGIFGFNTTCEGTNLNFENINGSDTILMEDPPVLINWSACRAEVNETSIPSGSSQADFQLVTPVTDLNKAFVMSDSSGTGTVTGGNDHLVTVHFLNTTHLRMQREASPGADAQVSFSVVECFNDEFTVQRGEVTLNSGSSFDTDTISSINDERSIVLVSERTDDTSANNANNIVTAELTDANTVRIERSASPTTTVDARYEVITFSNLSQVEVQTNEVTLSSGSTSVTDAITSVPLEDSFIFCSYDATDNGLQQTAIGCELTDDTTVSFYRHAGGAYTNRIRYYVVTWPNQTVGVQRATINTVEPTGADNTRFDYDIGITTVNESKAFPYITNTKSGTGTAFPRNRWIDFFLDTSTIRTSFWRPSTGTADQNNKYWQVLEFEGDSTRPAVNGTFPAEGAEYNTTDQVILAANATDNNVVVTLLANITYPNSSYHEVSLNFTEEGFKFNGTFGIPGELGGRYNVTFIAIDINNLINDTETTYFIAVDQPPEVYNVSSLPLHQKISLPVTINATVIDNNPDQVIAMIQYPNGSWFNVSLAYTGENNTYQGAFVNGTVIGDYNVTIFANDTGGNINDSMTSNFTIVYDNLTLTTDKSEYIIGEEVFAFATGFSAHTNISVIIFSPSLDPANLTLFPYNVTSNSTGGISFSWIVEDDSELGFYTINATEPENVVRSVTGQFQVVDAIIFTENVTYTQGDTALLFGEGWDGPGNVTINITDPNGVLLPGYPLTYEVNTTGGVSDLLFIDYNFTLGEYTINSTDLNNSMKSDLWLFNVTELTTDIYADTNWYKYGETVNIFGEGYSVNNTEGQVELHVYNSDNGLDVPTYPKDVSSNATGGVSDSFVPSTIALGNYTLNGTDNNYSNLNDSYMFRIVEAIASTNLRLYKTGDIAEITGNYWDRDSVVRINITNSTGDLVYSDNLTADSDGNISGTFEVPFPDGMLEEFNFTAYEVNDDSDFDSHLFNVSLAATLVTDRPYYFTNELVNMSGRFYTALGDVRMNISSPNVEASALGYPRVVSAGSDGNITDDVFNSTLFCKGDYLATSVDLTNPTSLFANTTIRIVGWWDDNWQHRQLINISDRSSGGLSEYQVNFTLDTASLISSGYMQSDCDDLRIVDPWDTELDFYIDESPLLGCNNVSTVIWTKVNNVTANSSIILQVYYGNTGASGTSDERAVFSFSERTTTKYVVSGDMASSGNLDIVSFEEDNSLQVGGQAVEELDEAATSTYGNSGLSQTTGVASTYPIFGSGDANDVDALMPISFAATEFINAHSRYDDIWHVYAPYGDATVTVYEGTVQGGGGGWSQVGASFDVTSGTATTVTRNIDGSAGTQSSPFGARITATAPVLVLHDQSNSGDVNAMYPPSRELWGIPNTRVHIGALEDVEVQILESDGTNNSQILLAGEAYVDETLGGLGTEEAWHLVANGSIGAIQQADGNGGESSVFLPQQELGRNYYLPHAYDYIAVATTRDTTSCSRYDATGAPIDSSAAAATNPYPWPGKILFGTGSAGDRINCTDPAYIYYEEAVQNDEHNAWSRKSHRVRAVEEPVVTLYSGHENQFECVEFDAIRPNVTDVTATPDPQFLGSNVTINASVVDDVNVSHVFANITLPNGSTRQEEMIDWDDDTFFDMLFNDTTAVGNYTLRTWANDTNHNINDSETLIFEIIHENLTLVTDNSDYVVNTTVSFVGTGFNAFTNISIFIYNETSDIVNISAFPRNITSNLTGGFNDSWFIPENQSLGTYYINATDTTDPTRTIVTSFMIVDAIIETLEFAEDAIDTHEQGTLITIQGRSWTPGGNVSVNITELVGGENVFGPTLFGVNSTGGINFTFFIDYNTTPQNYTILAAEENTTKTDTFNYMVIARAVEVSTLETWYKMGDIVNISGTGFVVNGSDPGVNLTVYNNDTNELVPTYSKNITSNDTGAINDSFTIGALAIGNYTVNASNYNFTHLTNTTLFQIVNATASIDKGTYGTGDTILLRGIYWNRSTEVNITIRNSTNDSVFSTTTIADGIDGSISVDIDAPSPFGTFEGFYLDVMHEGSLRDVVNLTFNVSLRATLETDHKYYVSNQIVNITGDFYSINNQVLLNLTNQAFAKSALGFPHMANANASGGFYDDTFNTTLYCSGTHKIDTVDQNAPTVLYANNTFEIVSWWDASWQYRQGIYVTENSDTDLTEYQINITVDTESLITQGKMNNNCSDIRFTDTSNNTLDYYIENLTDVTCGNSSTVIWVKVPSLPASEESMVLMYYGNALATNVSSVNDTFSYSSPQAVGYVATDLMSGASLDLFSLADGNTITDGSTTRNMDFQDTNTLPAPSLGTVISATKLFQADSTVDATDTISPISWAATDFVINSVRDFNYFSYVSPFGTANITLYESGSVVDSRLVGASGSAFQLDIGNGNAARVVSDIPVLVQYYSDNGATPDSDAFPGYGITTDYVYGIPTNTLTFASGPTAATVNWIDSDGNPGSAGLAANDAGTSGGTGGDAAGAVYRVSGTAPIGVTQEADTDGVEQTMFLPRQEMGTLFGSQKATEWVTIIAPQDTTSCTSYDSGGNFIETIVGGGRTDVNKIGFGTGNDVQYEPGGWYVACDKPGIAIFDEDVKADETHLWSFKQMRQYQYPEPSYEFIKEEEYFVCEEFDITPPNVTDLKPIENSNFTFNVTFNLSANATDNSSIDVVLAEIQFPNGTRMNYTLTDPESDTQFNFTFNDTEQLGIYNMTIIANDTWNNVNATENIFFNISDIIPPNFSNINVTPPSPVNYSSGQLYMINVSWSDNHGIDTVWIVHNFTGTETTLVLNDSGGGVYSFNISDLGPGNYTWQMLANDSSGNLNFTNETNYFVNSSGANINLTFNGTQGNLTVEVGEEVDVTGIILAPSSGQLELFEDGVLINNDTSTVINFTNRTVPGLYEFTLRFPGDENYSEATETHYLNVTDNRTPVVLELSPPNLTIYNTSTIINLSANVTDNFEVDTVIANVSWELGYMEIELVNGTIPDTFNNTFSNTTQPGIYNITFIANDTSGNINATEATQVIFLDRPYVFVDRTNYVFNQTVYINGTGFNLNTNVTIELFNSTLDNQSGFTVNATTDGRGRINWSWFINDTTPLGNYTVQINDTTEITRWNFTVFDVVTALIESNETLYLQGDTVDIVGSAWDFPGNVTYNITDPEGNLMFTYPRNRSANSTGEINDTFYLDFNATVGVYEINATGIENTMKYASYAFLVIKRNATLTSQYPWYKNGSVLNFTGDLYSNNTENVTLLLYNNDTGSVVGGYPQNTSSNSTQGINHTYVIDTSSFGNYTLNATDNVYPELNGTVEFQIVYATVDTDVSNYVNGETVYITGLYWNRSSNVTIDVTNITGDSQMGFPQNVTADENGTITTSLIALPVGFTDTVYNVTAQSVNDTWEIALANYTVSPQAILTVNDSLPDQNETVQINGSFFTPFGNVELFVRYTNGSGVFPFYPKILTADENGTVIDLWETGNLCSGSYLVSAIDLTDNTFRDNLTVNVTYDDFAAQTPVANDSAFEGTFSQSGGATTATHSTSDALYQNVGARDTSSDAFVNYTFNISGSGIVENATLTMDLILDYCHSGNQASPICNTGGNVHEGVVDGSQLIQIYNHTLGDWQTVGELSVDGTNDDEVQTQINFTSGFDDYINDSIIHVRYEADLNVSGFNDALLVVDYTALSFTYEQPVSRDCIAFDNTFLQIDSFNSSFILNTNTSIEIRNATGAFLDDDEGLDGIDGVVTSQFFKYLSPNWFESNLLEVTLETNTQNGTIESTIVELNVNESRNVTTQVVDHYNYALPALVYNLTSLFALNDTGIEFDHVSISIPNATPFDVIVHCLAWNYTTSECSNFEINDTDQFETSFNGSHTNFNVTSFDSFGGGTANSLPNISNIAIYDVTGEADIYNDGTLEEEGLNATFNLTSGFMYRVVFEIDNDGAKQWDFSVEDLVYHGGLNETWDIDNDTDVYYNVTNGDSGFGGTFVNGQVNWTLDTGDRVRMAESVNFTYIVNISTTEAEIYPVYYYVEDASENTGSNDSSTYNILANESNDTDPDIYVNQSEIYFAEVEPIEGANITINASIYNLGDTDANNVTIQFFLGNFTNGTQIGANQSINITAGGFVVVNQSWVTILGTSFINVFADPDVTLNGSINETNETNNNATANITVSSYHTFYGEVYGNVTIDNAVNLTLFKWAVENQSGNIYAADADSVINWQFLMPLGRNFMGIPTTNDFEELDAALNMTAFNDSINKTWTFEDEARNVSNITVFSNFIENVSIVNSTNNSFVTGILWDISDGGAEFDASQDVVFVNPVIENSTGYFGNYDYEIKVPSSLEFYQPDTDEVYFYAEIR